MAVKMMKGGRCYNINDSAEDIARAKSMGMVLADEPQAEAKSNAETEQTEQAQETQAETEQKPTEVKRTRRAKKDVQ